MPSTTRPNTTSRTNRFCWPGRRVGNTRKKCKPCLHPQTCSVIIEDSIIIHVFKCFLKCDYMYMYLHVMYIFFKMIECSLILLYICRVLSLHPVWRRSGTLSCCPVKWSLRSASKNKAFVLCVCVWGGGDICDHKNMIYYIISFIQWLFLYNNLFKSERKREFQQFCLNRSIISNGIWYFLPIKNSIKAKQWNFFLNTGIKSGFVVYLNACTWI